MRGVNKSTPCVRDQCWLSLTGHLSPQPECFCFTAEQAEQDQCEILMLHISFLLWVKTLWAHIGLEAHESVEIYSNSFIYDFFLFMLTFVASSKNLQSRLSARAIYSTAENIWERSNWMWCGFKYTSSLLLFYTSAQHLHRVTQTGQLQVLYCLMRDHFILHLQSQCKFDTGRSLSGLYYFKQNVRSV